MSTTPGELLSLLRAAEGGPPSTRINISKVEIENQNLNFEMFILFSRFVFDKIEISCVL